MISIHRELNGTATILTCVTEGELIQGDTSNEQYRNLVKILSAYNRLPKTLDDEAIIPSERPHVWVRALLTANWWELIITDVKDGKAYGIVDGVPHNCILEGCYFHKENIPDD
ncbi:hypothetical protein LCGC14_0357240 [marine sediment metagenome]|uniref:Uncharacterized protein n=1 Tax=marine sediment metagenome TaxID=412755 RepID=A0A0F9T955_9ZZZZ